MEFQPCEKSEVAERFRALRRKARLKQSRLAEIIGICRQSVSEIENARVMLHHSTWERFVDLETRHYQPLISFPEHWT